MEGSIRIRLQIFGFYAVYVQDSRQIADRLFGDESFKFLTHRLAHTLSAVRSFILANIRRGGAPCVSSCFSSHVRVLGAASVGFSSV